jgi:hypothetical protein
MPCRKLWQNTRQLLRSAWGKERKKRGRKNCRRSHWQLLEEQEAAAAVVAAEGAV